MGNDLAVGVRAAGKSFRKGSQELKATHPAKDIGERRATCKAKAPPIGYMNREMVIR